jgi:hypothetical protein
MFVTEGVSAVRNSDVGVTAMHESGELAELPKTGPKARD